VASVRKCPKSADSEFYHAGIHALVLRWGKAVEKWHSVPEGRTYSLHE
jgi:hypothetical protein